MNRAAILVPALMAMSPLAASAAVTSLDENFNSYGNGTFAFAESISDEAFFDGNWFISGGEALWSHSLQGDGAVSFREGNPRVGNGLVSNAEFAPGSYAVALTLQNFTSVRRTLLLVFGDLNTFVALGGEGVTEQTFHFSATVVPGQQRVAIASAFPFTFTPEVTRIVVTPVPIPGGLGLWALAGLLAVRRRKPV